MALTFTSSSDLAAAVSVTGSWSGLGNFVVGGLSVTQGALDDLLRVGKYLGEPYVPHDIRQQRRATSEVMRRLGRPVIIKHMWNPGDERLGLAKKSEDFFDIYGQTRNKDPFSYGTGYQSTDLASDEWITPDGTIVRSDTQPGPEFKQASKYRGFGPGYLTYIVEPDAALDLYKHTPEGALIRVQTATAQTAWFPEINDNDLIINVTLDKTGRIAETHERYTAKMTNPVTIRGDGRPRGGEGDGGGNIYLVNQQFEMVLLPSNNVLYSVEIDR
jgi:hypothetical protein